MEHACLIMMSKNIVQFNTNYYKDTKDRWKNVNYKIE